MTQIEQRVMLEAEYILKNNCTIRECSRYFGISKSTVHFDLSIRLKKLDFDCFLKVNKVFYEHFKNKHIVGGLATKRKYQIPVFFFCN